MFSTRRRGSAHDNEAEPSWVAALSPLPPTLNAQLTRGLAEYCWPVLFGGSVATAVGFYAASASGTNEALIWASAASLGFACTAAACFAAWRTGNDKSLSVADRMFSFGALVATIGTAGLVSSIVLTTDDMQLQALLLMLAMAVIGAANGTSIGRPMLVAAQSLLLTVATAMSVAVAWDGLLGWAGALGIYGYGITSVALALRSHGVQAALLIARDTVAQERTRLAATVQHLPLALAILDKDRNVVTMNHSATALLGVGSGEAMVHQPFHDVLMTAPRLTLATTDRDEFIRRVEQLTVGRQPVDIVLRLNDHRVMDVQGQPLPDGGWIVMLRDTTGERAAFAELNREARRCPLTGLPN
ncbi:PAS-domain containing protein, partial [Sandarakinorhabdus sp.]|uniref:PAS-domain containing protein n=1 Tax=Sandarakinorhabdus sp. TaxID=1916663 RepID=UPI00286E17CD